MPYAIGDDKVWINAKSGTFWGTLINFAILFNSMTLTSFVFTQLADTVKYGEGSHITLFSPSDVTAFHRITPYSTEHNIRLLAVYLPKESIIVPYRSPGDSINM